MNLVRFLLCFALTLIVFGNANGQVPNRKKIDSLIVSFEHLSDKRNDYKLEFIDNKNTLIFKFKTENSEEIGYKVILTDIHPLGIFIFESNHKNYIRILSIDNGHRFIKEKFRNGFRLSSTTNIIDIELSKNVDFVKVAEIMKKMKNILENSENKSDEIQIAVPKSTMKIEIKNSN